MVSVCWGVLDILEDILVGHKNLKNCPLKFLRSTENITRTSLLNFPLPGTDKRQSFKSSQTSLQITIQQHVKFCQKLKSSAQLPLCPVVSICVEQLFVFSTKVSTFLRRPPTVSLPSLSSSFYKGKLLFGNCWVTFGQIVFVAS